MTLTWRSREPAAVALALAQAGFWRVGAGAAALFERSGLHVRLVTAEAGEDDRLEGGSLQRPGSSGYAGSSRLPAVGWATVDAERLASAWEVDLEPLETDHLLGARAWLVVGARPATLLLEPATEGRLAAALARHGEGPVAVYSAAAGGEDAAGGNPARGAGTSSFGAAALVGPQPRWGPFLVLVSTRARRVPSAQ